MITGMCFIWFSEYSDAAFVFRYYIILIDVQLLITGFQLSITVDRKDQKTLEKLRAERQAKIDELKERTNYYTTQQLIQVISPFLTLCMLSCVSLYAHYMCV